MKWSSLVGLSALAVMASVGLSAFQKQPPFDLKASVARGRETYITYCLSCHLDQGEGIEGIYPPLAKSDYLMADKNRAVRQILYGVNGEMVVNGKTYSGEMTGVELSDQEVSDVVNYIRNSFGNKGGAMTPQQVAALRKK